MFFGFFVKLPITHLTSSDLKFHQKILTIDLAGFFGLALSCIMLLLGLEYGGSTYPWDSATVIGLLCGGTVGIICLIGWFIYKRDGALIPPRLLRNRINASIGITSFLQGGCIYISSYWLPIWFQGVKQASPIGSGVMILPTIISQFVAAVICGALVQRLGYYLPEVIFGNSMIAAGAALMTVMTPDTTEAMWIGFQILLGVGRGFVLQLVTLLSMIQLPRIILTRSISWLSLCRPTYQGKTLHSGLASCLSCNTSLVPFSRLLPKPSSPHLFQKPYTNTHRRLAHH